jgi:hypothetical protein
MQTTDTITRTEDSAHAERVSDQTETSNKRIAVVIATYQRPDALKRCVEGVDEGDIILVFNEWIDINSVMGGYDNIVHLIRTDKRGAGVKTLGGDWAAEKGYETIVFLDDECVPVPGAISILYEGLHSLDNMGIVGGGSRWATREIKPDFVTHTGDFWITKTKDWIESKGMDITMRVAEDYDYQLRLRLNGKLVHVDYDANFSYELEAPGGLSESGMWRGEDRNTKGRMYAIKRLGYKFPGLMQLDSKFQENYDVFYKYMGMHADGLIEFDREEGVVWTT